jgi:hypothetical protein
MILRLGIPASILTYMFGEYYKSLSTLARHMSSSRSLFVSPSWTHKKSNYLVELTQLAVKRV